MDSRLIAFEKLLTIMDELRAKCPWDQKQTFETLRHLTIEEVYELSDAILKNDTNEIKKELGDVLLHIIFYAKIGSETNAFNIETVINTLSEKLIYRHPHIYGNVKADDVKTVSENWEKLKNKEHNKGTLSGVPNSMPSLIKAMRIQHKAQAVGFDWENKQDVLNKVHEELKELEVEIEQNNIQKAELEFGDLFFSLINYARHININPEDALEKVNQKFIKRFNYIEQKITSQGKTFAEFDLQAMDLYWNEAKQLEKDK